VAPGTHKLIYTAGKKDFTEQVTVLNNITTVNGEETAPLQNFSVVYNMTQPSLASKLVPVIIIVALAAIAFYILRSRQNSSGSIGGRPLDPDLVVVGGAGRSFTPNDKAEVHPPDTVITPGSTGSASSSPTPMPTITPTVTPTVMPTANKIEIK
jgi:hypothetical protein